MVVPCFSIIRSDIFPDSVPSQFGRRSWTTFSFGESLSNFHFSSSKNEKLESSPPQMTPPYGIYLGRTSFSFVLG